MCSSCMVVASIGDGEHGVNVDECKVRRVDDVQRVQTRHDVGRTRHGERHIGDHSRVFEIASTTEQENKNFDLFVILSRFL